LDYTKAELLERYTWKCPLQGHRGHNGLEHPRCYEKLKHLIPSPEHYACVDIETTGLNANFDYIISYDLYTWDKRHIGRSLEKEEVLNFNVLDKVLLKDFCSRIRDFSRVIVYWGKDRRHDLPFLRTRALHWDCDFPKYKELNMVDCYDLCKNKLRLHRYRLETVCNFLHIPSKGHRLDWEVWQKGKLGDDKSLEYIYAHNKEDTESLYNVYNIMRGFSKESRVSI